MSVINRMLRELDRRQGLGTPETGLPPQNVRVVPEVPASREWFWRILAVLMVAAVGWVAWIAWQLRPHTLATGEAFRAAEEAQRRAAQRAVRAGAELKSEPPNSGLGEVAQGETESRKTGEPQPGKPPAVDTLRLAQALSTPISAAPLSATIAERKASAPSSGAAGKPSPKTETVPAPPSGGEGGKGNAQRLGPAGVPELQLLPAPAARVERRERPRSPAERAEGEFLRGAGLLAQARVAEAEEAFAAALAADPAHQGARQALVALALEARRVDEAHRLLEEGLANQPTNAQFALALARIMVGRGEHSRALEVLDKASTAALSNPDYHLLRAGALVRLARHGEAVQAYHAALRLDAANAQAWVGLGVALEALGNTPEAAEAFRRALAAGPISAELRDFAEQRVRAIR